MNDTSQNPPTQDPPVTSNDPSNQPPYIPTTIPDSSASDFFPSNSPASNVHMFVGGRLISTALELLLLIGGLTAGIVLVQEPQLLEQKAAGINPECASKPKCEMVWDADRNISGYCDGNGNKVDIKPVYETCSPNDTPRVCSTCSTGNCTQMCVLNPIVACPNITNVWSGCINKY